MGEGSEEWHEVFELGHYPHRKNTSTINLYVFRIDLDLLKLRNYCTKLIKKNQPQKHLWLKYFKQPFQFPGVWVHGIELLFAQSLPKLTSTSTVEVGSGLIKICALESMPNTDCRYFSV